MRLVPLMSLIAIAVFLSAAAAILWGVTIAGAWKGPIPHQVMADARVGAAVASVSAVLCWLKWADRRRDEREGLLIRTIAHVTRPPASPARRQAEPLRATLPLHRVW